MSKASRKTLIAPLAALLIASAAVIAACGGSSGNTLSLVAYSTPQEAYQKLIPAFQKTSESRLL